MNNTYVQQLFAVLENTTKLHQALYTLANDKREVLVKNDITKLTELMKSEQQLLKAIQKLEAERQNLTTMLFQEKGVSVENGTLLDLIKLSTDIEIKEKLTGYRDELLRVIGQLQIANEANQQLLGHSLEYVELSLDLFTDRPEEDFIYQPPGNQPSSQVNRSIINHKA